MKLSSDNPMPTFQLVDLPYTINTGQYQAECYVCSLLLYPVQLAGGNT